jgi:hypothetical protein
MNIKTFIKDTQKIAKISTVIIFLALIRSICEPFRLQYYSPTALIFDNVKPFLLGALAASISLLAMTILFYYGKHKTIISICILTIVALLILKKIYLIP